MKITHIEILFLNHFKKFIIETSRKFLDIKKNTNQMMMI